MSKTFPCVNCNEMVTVPTSTFYDRAQKDTPFLCKKCMKEYKIKNLKATWNSKSEEWRKNFSCTMSEISLETWRNYSPERRDDRIASWHNKCAKRRNMCKAMRALRILKLKTLRTH